MCQMDVKPSMRYQTVSQALAHNASTLNTNMHMLAEYLTTQHRKTHLTDAQRIDHLQRIQEASELFGTAYKLLLANWSEAMCAEVMCGAFDRPDQEPAMVRDFGAHVHWEPSNAQVGALFLTEQLRAQGLEVTEDAS